MISFTIGDELMWSAFNDPVLIAASAWILVQDSSVQCPLYCPEAEVPSRSSKAYPGKLPCIDDPSPLGQSQEMMDRVEDVWPSLHRAVVDLQSCIKAMGLSEPTSLSVHIRWSHFSH
jgi:hypothetical protein